MDALKNLQELYLSHNGITGKLLLIILFKNLIKTELTGLTELKKLNILDVGNNQIKKLTGLKEVKNLHEFWVF